MSVIFLELSQTIWPQYFIVTDRQIDGRTYDLPSLCVALRSKNHGLIGEAAASPGSAIVLSIRLAEWTIVGTCRVVTLLRWSLWLLRVVEDIASSYGYTYTSERIIMTCAICRSFTLQGGFMLHHKLYLFTHYHRLRGSGNIVTSNDRSPANTRKVCYRKDDRAMRPIYGCSEYFRDSLTTPTATIPNIFHGLLFRSTLWMFL